MERAEKQARDALQVYPNDLLGEVMLARILATRGKLPEAEQIVRKLATRSPRDPTVQNVVMLLEALEGKPASIPRWLDQFGRVYWADSGYSIDVAEVLAVAHQNGEALRWLRRADELGIRNYPFLVGNPLYKNLQTDPDFQTYLESTRQAWLEAVQHEKQTPLLPVTFLHPHTGGVNDRLGGTIQTQVRFDLGIHERRCAEGS